MARYNEVKIGTVYLTSTGLTGGKPCKVEVTGLPIFRTTRTGQVLNSADGTPYAQLVNVGHKGVLIEVKTDWMTTAVFDSIVTIFETAKNTPAGITVVVTGDTGTFTLGTVPAVPDDISFEGFSNGYIKGAIFRFRVT